MIKDFLIISCTGSKDKIGLKINNNFFIQDFQTKTKKNDELVSTILKFVDKHNVVFGDKFSIIVNYGPGSFSSIRIAIAVAKGIKLSKKIKLYGFKNSDLPQFSLKYIDFLINEKLLEKNLINPIYLS